jgi:uncharacterized membrane protein
MRLMPFLRRWALPLSLALNVFLVTVVVVRPSLNHRPGPPDAQEIAQHIAATLPPADGAILLAVAAAHKAEFERSHAARHTIPGKIKAVLERPQLDLTALRTVFAENRDASIALDDALAATIEEVVTRISPEGRAKLAQWQPPRPPGGGPGGPPPPP